MSSSEWHDLWPSQVHSAEPASDIKIEGSRMVRVAPESCDEQEPGWCNTHSVLTQLIWEVLWHDQRIGLGIWSDLSWISDPEQCLELEMDDGALAQVEAFEWRRQCLKLHSSKVKRWKTGKRWLPEANDVGNIDMLTKEWAWANGEFEKMIIFFLGFPLVFENETDGSCTSWCTVCLKQMFIPILKLIYLISYQIKAVPIPTNHEVMLLVNS